MHTLTLPRRPLVGLALAFLAGTGVGLVHPAPLIGLLPVAAALLIASVCLTHLLPSAATGCLVVTLAIIGWANASPPGANPPTSLSEAIALPCGALVRGRITDEPVCVATRGSKTTWKLPLAVTRVRSGSAKGWQSGTGQVRVRLYALPGERIPAYGEEWIFAGYLAQATYKHGYLAGKAGTLFLVGSAAKARLAGTGGGNSLVATCLEWRGWACKLLAEGLEDRPDQQRILNSILLGYYSQIPRELYQAFARTGTLHVFAISGSHVVIFGGAVIFILASCGVPRTHWVLILGPLLVLYTAMTGLQPSAVRACIMGVIYWIAPLIGRKPDIHTTLAASAILILAVVPEDLANIGFILSYVAVLGLVLFCPVFTALLHRCFQRDPLKLEPEPRWRNVLRAAWIMFSDLLSVSLAAWLVTTPLSLLFFGTFSPIGLPSNLLVVPLSSVVIITGVLSLGGGSCFLWLADLFNHANLALIIMMTATARWFASVPHGCISAPPVPLGGILGFYTALLSIRFMIWIYTDGKANTRMESDDQES